jgi:hypothetical protein
MVFELEFRSPAVNVFEIYRVIQEELPPLMELSFLKTF